jgi:hypothetical protein
MIEELLKRIGQLESKVDLLLEQTEAKSTIEPAYNRTWFSTPACVEQLGCTRTKLYALRASGRLGKSGDGWRQVNSKVKSKRPTYQWNIQYCQQKLSKSLAFK